MPVCRISCAQSLPSALPGASQRCRPQGSFPPCCRRLFIDRAFLPGRERTPPVLFVGCRCIAVQRFFLSSGARARAIVPVRVRARVVAILVAQTDVAAVVVVATAPGEALNHRTIKRSSPNLGTFPVITQTFPPAHQSFLLSFSLVTLAIQPPISLPISTIFSDHTP